MRKMRWATVVLCAGLLSGCAQRVLVQPAVDMKIYSRMAVLPFETDSFLSTIGSQLADEIVVNLLQKAPDVNVVERGRVDALIQEQSLAQQGYVSPETAVKVGRLLGARLIATGSVSVAIGDIRPTPLSHQRVANATATLRLIDTETGKIMWAKRENAQYSTFLSKDDGVDVYIPKTDQEMIQEAVKDLGVALAQSFYPHYELRY